MWLHPLSHTREQEHRRPILSQGLLYCKTRKFGAYVFYRKSIIFWREFSAPISRGKKIWASLSYCDCNKTRGVPKLRCEINRMPPINTCTSFNHHERIAYKDCLQRTPGYSFKYSIKTHRCIVLFYINKSKQEITKLSIISEDDCRS